MFFGIDYKTNRKLMEFESDCYALPLSFCFSMILFWASNLSFDYFNEVEEECSSYEEIEEPLNNQNTSLSWILVYNAFIIFIGFFLSQIPYCKSKEQCEVEEDDRETFDHFNGDDHTLNSRFSIGNTSNLGSENDRNMTKAEIRHDIIRCFITELFNNVNGFTFGLGGFLFCGYIFGTNNSSYGYFVVASFLTHYAPRLLYKRQNVLIESSKKIEDIKQKNEDNDDDNEKISTLYLEFIHRRTKLYIIGLKVCLGWAYEEIIITLITYFNEDYQMMFAFFLFIIQFFVASFVQYYISKHNLAVNDVNPEDFPFRFTKDFKKMKKLEQKEFATQETMYVVPVTTSPMQNN